MRCDCAAAEMDLNFGRLGFHLADYYYDFDFDVGGGYYGDEVGFRFDVVGVCCKCCGDLDFGFDSAPLLYRLY